jgi:hypothetical protein
MSRKSMSMRSASGLTALLLAGLLVSACGGSGESGGVGASVGSAGGSVEPTPLDGADSAGGSVPAEASSSKEAMLAWAKSLRSSETEEPMRTNTFRPPLDETTETSPG